MTHRRRRVQLTCRLRRAFLRVLTGNNRTQSNPRARTEAAKPRNRSSFTASPQNGAQTKFLKFLCRKYSAPRRPIASLSSITQGIARSFRTDEISTTGTPRRKARISPNLPNVQRTTESRRLSIRLESRRHHIGDNMPIVLGSIAGRASIEPMMSGSQCQQDGSLAGFWAHFAIILA
jgi:hypothetical protein